MSAVASLWNKLGALIGVKQLLIDRYSLRQLFEQAISAISNSYLTNSRLYIDINQGSAANGHYLALDFVSKLAHAFAPLSVEALTTNGSILTTINFKELHVMLACTLCKCVESAVFRA